MDERSRGLTRRVLGVGLRLSIAPSQVVELGAGEEEGCKIGRLARGEADREWGYVTRNAVRPARISVGEIPKRLDAWEHSFPSILCLFVGCKNIGEAKAKNAMRERLKHDVA